MSTIELEKKIVVEVGGAPAEGKITDEAVAAARNMIGLQLRPEGPYRAAIIDFSA